MAGFAWGVAKLAPRNPPAMEKAVPAHGSSDRLEDGAQDWFGVRPPWAQVGRGNSNRHFSRA
jgi:hypothetical protein